MSGIVIFDYKAAIFSIRTWGYTFSPQSAILQGSSHRHPGMSDEHNMPSWITQHLSVVVAATAVPVAAGIAIWWTLSHRKSAAEIERERREHLVLHGRIIDGTVLDWTEQPDTGDLGVLHYRYDIAGVTYECAQDLVQLSMTVDTSCFGMPTSVRYDPKNPANSIIAAETWSGLRRTSSQ